MIPWRTTGRSRSIVTLTRRFIRFPFIALGLDMERGQPTDKPRPCWAMKDFGKQKAHRYKRRAIKCRASSGSDRVPALDPGEFAKTHGSGAAGRASVDCTGGGMRTCIPRRPFQCDVILKATTFV